MVKKTKNKDVPDNAVQHIYNIQLNDEQIVHVLAGLSEYASSTRKNAKNNKKERIKMTKGFIELQAFGDKWREDPDFQSKIKSRYWAD